MPTERRSAWCTELDSGEADEEFMRGATMEQKIDSSSLDYRLGHASGRSLAMLEGKLSDPALVLEATEHYDRSTLSLVLSKAAFVHGFVRGFHSYFEEGEATND